MKCLRCGTTNNPEDSRFCTECGAILVGDNENKYDNRLQSETDELKANKDLINGHEYVDLALPSGTLWATCNIGASNPEEHGDFYAWGEVCSKKEFSLSTSKWYGVIKAKRWYELFDRDLISIGVVDSTGNLVSKYDVATQKWGNRWHMPTLSHFIELIKYTSNTMAFRKGVRGRLITSKINGNSLFFPCGGFRYSTGDRNALVGPEELGEYWSSTVADDKHTAYHLSFDTQDEFTTNNTMRLVGRNIRPVSNV